MLIISLVMVLVLTAVDQIIKYIVINKITVGEVIHIIKLGSTELLNFTHIRNTGAAWSIMQGKTWFLIGLPIIVVIVGAVYMYKKRKDITKLEMTSISMVLAGGIGNLIDRIRYNEVVDYVSVKFINFPIFNFADICVVVGMILLFVYIIFFDNSGKSKVEVKSDRDVKKPVSGEEDD